MTVTYGGLMPLDAVFHPDGSFTVLCDGAVLFFDGDGNQLRRYALTGMTLVGADMGSGYVALIGAENALGSENRVVVLDTAGEELLSQMYRERMQQVCLTRREDGDPLCAVLTSGAVLSMDESGICSVCLLEDDDVLTLRNKPSDGSMRRVSNAILLVEKDKAESGEAFTDNVIMYEVLSELKDIAARGGVGCSCGSKAYSVQVGRGAVDLICGKCGGRLRIPAATDEDLDRLCCQMKLEIRGK